jgi:hypothetical protein
MNAMPTVKHRNEIDLRVERATSRSATMARIERASAQRESISKRETILPMRYGGHRQQSGQE